MDTIVASYKMLDELNVDRTDFRNVIDFYSKLNWNKFLEETNEIGNAFSDIDKIVKSKLFNVNILTHVTSFHEAEAKINYIQSKTHDLTIITVPKSIDKTKVVNAKDSILIDDYTRNLDIWSSAGGIGIKFSLKSKNEKYHTITELKEIIEYEESI